MQQTCSKLKVSRLERQRHVVRLIDEFEPLHQLTRQLKGTFRRYSAYYLEGKPIRRADLAHRLILYSLAKYPRLNWPGLKRALLDQCEMITLTPS